MLIPCYNEVENAGPISKAVTDILEKELTQYDYELVFIDNDSCVFFYGLLCHCVSLHIGLYFNYPLPQNSCFQH